MYLFATDKKSCLFFIFTTCIQMSDVTFALCNGSTEKKLQSEIQGVKFAELNLRFKSVPGSDILVSCCCFQTV